MVVPYFNPGPKLADNVERLIKSLEDSTASFEVIAVSDDSTDGSEKLLKGIHPAVFHHVVLPTNVGKGEALRVGLNQGRGDYLGFIDADGDVDPTQIKFYLQIANLHHPDIVLGSKRHPESKVVYPPIRRIYSVVYQLLVRTLFRLNVKDTQTGLKLIKREVLRVALPRMLEKRFAFDLELLVVANHLGFNDFIEAPVNIGRRFTSTISTKAVWHILLDTLAIFYRLHLRKSYDKTKPESNKPY